MDALKKGLIQGSLGIDGRQIGELCVDALDEYHESGHVSNYFNIGIEMLTGDNLDSYQAARENDQQERQESGEE